MKILGIDTTTKFLCLGIYDGEKIYEYNLEVARRLSSLITVTLKRVLDALSLRLSDIDYFALGLGPGSFTGIRTGLATIKGLCWALKKPLIGISTLAILAREARDTAKAIVPFIDAKRGLVYCAIFRNKDARLIRVKPDMLLNPEELFRKITGQAAVLGDAIDLYKDKILTNISGVTILDKDYWYPKGHNIIRLALERISQKKLDNPFEIKPIYLYPKECQVKIKN